jgi:bacterial/archaeal transporter family protein
MTQYTWLPAALGYTLAVGTLGVVAKLALKDTGWQTLVLVTTACYVIFSVVVLLKFGLKLPSQPGGSLIALLLTGALTAGSFALLITALSRGKASMVVPVTASYPVVTAILSVVLLSEPFSWIRFSGTALIVLGVVLVSLQANTP